LKGIGYRVKIKIDYIKEGDNEVVIRCKEIDDEILGIMSLLNMKNRKITGYCEDTIHMLLPDQIYYIETVDDVVFAYTNDKVYKVTMTLADLEQTYRDFGFFRCSKSMIINLNMIATLKSDLANRIIVTLKNQEKIVISRHYSKAFREFLKNQI
jgi:DNA-binding LytR/AlgR family response regulator